MLKPNAISSTGKVHSVRSSQTTRYTPYCNSAYNLATNGWSAGWRPTDKPITCKTCLRAYWPDGRERA